MVALVVAKATQHNLFFSPPPHRASVQLEILKFVPDGFGYGIGHSLKAKLNQ